MTIHDESTYHIYFGDSSDNMYPEEYLQWSKETSILEKRQVAPIARCFSLKNILFLRQVHSTQGCVVTSNNLFQSFAKDGDFLMTHHTAIGLGIVTADCLPLVCFDKKKNIVGIAHVGWKGAVRGIIPAMLTSMQQEWQSSFSDLIFFFGPSAKGCCYQVGKDFLQHLIEYPWKNYVLHQKGFGYFFDIPLFTQYQLLSLGVAKGALHTQYNKCTICTPYFFSYRRSCNTDIFPIGRQMTIVSLKARMD